MQVLIAVFSLVAGTLLGFFIRSNSARRESALLEQRNREAIEALGALQKQLAQAQTESATRAGFESLATERDKTIARLTSERDVTHSEVQSAIETARTQAARISQLEADLNNERQNMADKIALLETAKQALANQFQTLATEILEQKSKTFSEGNQKELGTLLAPLREQIKEFREKVERVQTESTTGVTELKTLIGTLGTLNQALTEEARNLSTALRGSVEGPG